MLFLKAFLSQRIIISNVGKRNGYVVTHSGLGIEKEMCLKKCGLNLEFVILPYSLLDEVSFWPGQTFLGRTTSNAAGWLVGVSKLFLQKYLCLHHALHAYWVSAIFRITMHVEMY